MQVAVMSLPERQTSTTVEYDQQGNIKALTRIALCTSVYLPFVAVGNRCLPGLGFALDLTFNFECLLRRTVAGSISLIAGTRLCRQLSIDALGERPVITADRQGLPRNTCTGRCSQK
jgi:hypothetical protein